MFGTTRPPHLPRLPCHRTRDSEPSGNVLSLNEPTNQLRTQTISSDPSGHCLCGPTVIRTLFRNLAKFRTLSQGLLSSQTPRTEDNATISTLTPSQVTVN